MTAVIFSIIAAGCKKEDKPNNPFNEDLENGVMVVNQGSFGNGNGDISFYNRETKKASNALFQTVNSRPAGDLVQSVTRYNGKYYIVANGSGKIEIAEEISFYQSGVISDLHQPRYMQVISSSKAYVSEWGSDGMMGTIAVIDLNTKTITKRIDVGKGPENMLIYGNSVYVACSGGYAHDSTVFVINAETDAVDDTIMMEKNPNSLAVDSTGTLWVLCGGKMTDDWMAMEVQPALVKVDMITNQVIATMSMNGSWSPAGNLCINKAKNTLAFNLLYGTGIYFHATNQSSISPSPAISKAAYGLGIDPKTDDIYFTKTGDGSSADWVFRYNKNYQVLDSFQVGLYPGGFLFN